MDLVLIAGLGMASALDWRLRKVPNWLTMSLIFTGILFWTFTEGVPGLAQSLTGFALGLILLYIPFCLGGMGGGDVKLLGAIGAFVGPIAVFKVFLASGVLGGLIAAIEITRKRAWRKSFESIKNRLLHFVLTRKLVSEGAVSFTPNPIRIPYAVILSGGYLCLYLFGGVW